MPRISTLRLLFAHNDWARDHVIEMASPLSDEQLDQPFEMGLGSLRGTLYHLWAAERLCLNRWLGDPTARYTEAEAPLNVADLSDRFRATAAERDDFLEQIGEAGEAKPITFTGRQGDSLTFPLGDMMLQICNHGFHHRAQALNMLRRLGTKARHLDFLFMQVDTPVSPVAYDLDTIREYLRYGDWACARLHAIAAALSDDQLDRPCEMGVGPLRKTLLHIHDGEQWLLEHCLGEGTTPPKELPDATPIAELSERWGETTGRRNDFLATQSNDDLQRTVTARHQSDQPFSFSVGDAMLQLGGHGTHHRAQVLNMLRHLGTEPPALDYLVWLREAAPSPA
ncbi:MAG: DinB family protein [Planctomycetota bacterium]